MALDVEPERDRILPTASDSEEKPNTPSPRPGKKRRGVAPEFKTPPPKKPKAKKGAVSPPTDTDPSLPPIGRNETMFDEPGWTADKKEALVLRLLAVGINDSRLDELAADVSHDRPSSIKGMFLDVTPAK